MRAIRVAAFGGPEVLKLVTDIPIPRVSRGQVLVKLHSTGINPLESLIRLGLLYKPALPYTPGTDGAGEVTEVGEGVTKLKKGDRVYTFGSITGTYAEYSLCKEENVHPLPGSVSFQQGAGIGVPYYTAYRCLFHKLKIRPAETVLVHGASGGVGLAAVQLAISCGSTVFGTAGTDDGLDSAKKAGAHKVFNHRKPEYIQQIKDATGGGGVDAILEVAGDKNLMKDLDMIKAGGRVVVIGSSGSPMKDFNPGMLMAKEPNIMGASWTKATEAEFEETSAYINTGLELGWLRPIIAHEYPLDQAPKAHGDITGGSGSRGKLVFVI